MAQTSKALTSLHLWKGLNTRGEMSVIPGERQGSGGTEEVLEEIFIKGRGTQPQGELISAAGPRGHTCFQLRHTVSKPLPTRNQFHMVSIHLALASSGRVLQFEFQ